MYCHIELYPVSIYLHVLLLPQIPDQVLDDGVIGIDTKDPE